LHQICPGFSGVNHEGQSEAEPCDRVRRHSKG
jgi:hypothetical protein